jgi:hypothetical protein
MQRRRRRRDGPRSTNQRASVGGLLLLCLLRRGMYIPHSAISCIHNLHHRQSAHTRPHTLPVHPPSQSANRSPDSCGATAPWRTGGVADRVYLWDLVVHYSEQLRDDRPAYRVYPVGLLVRLRSSLEPPAPCATSCFFSEADTVPTAPRCTQRLGASQYFRHVSVSLSAELADERAGNHIAAMRCVQVPRLETKGARGQWRVAGCVAYGVYGG